MRPLPRLALAASTTDTEPALATLSLLGALTHLGWRVQHFRAWASPLNTQVIGPITGLPGRHLDTWLMPPEICRTVFARGARGADLAVVEGVLQADETARRNGKCCLRALSDCHGPLQPLVSMLDLPIVAMVDCRGCSGQHLPCVPPEADAVILHGVSSEEDAGKLRSMARLLLGKPVLGVVPDMPGLRCMLEDLPLGCTIPDPWVERLARGFLKFADIEALRAVAESRTAPCQDCCVDHGVTCENLFSRRLRVAYAMDDAFGGYFPDTLETLELLGAELFEFSPLRDENLPHGAELVMIGCGFPDQFADRLAANHSLIAALRAHVCAGGRVYSEGGGTAYLSRSMLLGDRQVPGAGILPYDAELISPQSWPQPVERRITHDGWLGGRGTSVRGYLSNRWRLQGVAEPEHCPSTAGRLTQEGDIVFRYNAVGSLIHLHLAALPHVVAGFVGRTLRAIGSGLAHQ